MHPSPPPLNFRALLVAAILISFVTLAIYSQVGAFEFNNFDDPDYVAQNETVQRGITLDGILWAFSTNFMGNWHPLTWLSHMFDCQFFGLDSGAHHWTSALLHLVNSLLLLYVLSRYTRAIARSAIVAVLFAVHPLHVESVAWIAERKDVLSAFFWFLTMWAYLRYVEDRSPARYLLVLLSLAFGLMSKPMVVTLPCVLLLLDYWPLRRVAILWDWWRLFLEKLPMFALVLVSSVVTFIVQKQGGAVGSFEKFSLVDRLANALVAYAAYLGKTIFPVNLAAFYPHPGSWPLWQVIGAAVWLIIVTIVAVSLRRRETSIVVGWLWYLGTLVPVIGVVQVGDQAYADRYTYIPLIGIFIAVVWGMADLANRFKWPHIAVRAGAAALLLLYAAVAMFQVRHWQSSETLFRHALAVTEDNYVAQYNLAQTLSVRGRIQEAVEHYYETLRLKPDHEGAHNNLGFTFALRGDWQRATNHYTLALRSDPANPDVHFNMGIAQINLGSPTNAIRHFTIALRERPSHPLAHRYLAEALVAVGRTHDAIVHYRKAVKINPDQPEAINNLAWLLATHPDPALRNGKEAVQLAQRACQLTHFNIPLMLGTLAAAHAEAGQFDHAIETARRAETLATQQGLTDVAMQNAALREKYARHQPHRQ